MTSILDELGIKNTCIICGEISMENNLNSKLLIFGNCDLKNKYKYKRFSIPRNLYYMIAANAAKNNMDLPDYLAILMTKDIAANIGLN